MTRKKTNPYRLSKVVGGERVGLLWCFILIAAVCLLLPAAELRAQNSSKAGTEKKSKKMPGPDRPLVYDRSGVVIVPREPVPGETADRLSRTAAEQIKTFKLLDGYEINLFADESLGVVNPIHMTWDPQGRLWVTCAPTYPHLQPGKPPNDYILVLEDTDDDGRADKSVKFAEGLYVPTGLELGDGGVYCANAPDLLFLKDTDGDGKADYREIVFTGFGSEDNHHSISAFRWGPGGFLYFQEGTFLHSQVETPYGLVKLIYGGVFQLRTKPRKLDVYANVRFSNPWGHMFDRWGRSTLVDNARFHFLAPETANSPTKIDGIVIAPTNRGKTCGGDFLFSRHLTDDVQGLIALGSYKAHGISLQRLDEAGSGYSVKYVPWLIECSDLAFRPVDVKTGPRGEIFVLDWYNPLIDHTKDVRDPRRDKSRGRVWRVTNKNRPLLEKPELVGTPLPKLLDYLKAPESWTSYQVKRVISVMDPEPVVGALDTWVKNLDSTDSDFEHHRLEALWCYQTVDSANESLLTQVLASKNPAARQAAVRVLRYWWPEVKTPLKLLERAVADENAQVRLEAVLTLGFIPRPESVSIAVRVIDGQTDQFIDEALRMTIEGLRPIYAEPARAGQLKFAKESHHQYIMSGLDTGLAIKPLTEALKSGDLEGKDIKRLVAPVADVAKKEEVTKVWSAIADVDQEDRLETQLVVKVLNALEQAARQRKVQPDAYMYNLDKVSAFYKYRSPAVQVAAYRLTGAWRYRKSLEDLLAAATSTDQPMPVRIAATEAIADMVAPKLIEKTLAPLSSEEQTITTRYLGLLGIARADIKRAAPSVGKIFAADPTDADPVPIVACFLERNGGAALLGKVLSDQPPHAATAVRILAHLNKVGEQNKVLVKALTPTASGEMLDQQLVKLGADKVLANVKEHGDATRGEMIFRKPELACMACHAVAGAGPEIGPELTVVGNMEHRDVVDSLLEPSKVIKDLYENVTVTMKDGSIIAGIRTYDDDQQVIVRSAGTGVTAKLAKENVKSIATMPSLMPPGLVNQLSKQQVWDLVAYLTVLGRVPEFQPGTAPLIRRWRTRTVAQPPKPAALGPLTEDPAWMPAYSTVAGDLPATDLKTPAGMLLVRADIDTTRAGQAKIKINDPQGVTLWINGKPADPGSGMIALPVGRAALIFVVDQTKRGDAGLRVSLSPAAESGAAFSIVGGM